MNEEAPHRPDDTENTRALAAPCARVRGRLEELWDRALDPLEDARDRGHLEACAGCAEEWRALEALLVAVADSRATEAELAWLEEGLDRRLARARTASPPSTRSRLVFAALPIAAGIAALVLLQALSADRLPFGGSLPVTLRDVQSWRPPVADWTRGVELLIPTVVQEESEEG